MPTENSSTDEPAMIGTRAAARILGVAEHTFRRHYAKDLTEWRIKGGKGYWRYEKDQVVAMAESEAEVAAMADAAWSRATASSWDL